MLPSPVFLVYLCDWGISTFYNEKAGFVFLQWYGGVFLNPHDFRKPQRILMEMRGICPSLWHVVSMFTDVDEESLCLPLMRGINRVP